MKKRRKKTFFPVMVIFFSAFFENYDTIIVDKGKESESEVDMVCICKMECNGLN